MPPSLKRKQIKSEDMVVGKRHHQECHEGHDHETSKILEAKRAYNRLNAARARQRTKEHLTALCQRLDSYAEKSKLLNEKNKELALRAETLLNENKLLKQLLLEQESTRMRMLASSDVAIQLEKLRRWNQGLATRVVPTKLASTGSIPLWKQLCK